MSCRNNEGRLFCLISLLSIQSSIVSAQQSSCSLCPLDAAPLTTTTTATPSCIQLAADAEEPSVTVEECIAIQFQGVQQCNCPPWPCPICQDGVPMEFPSRLVYRTEENPISCSDLQELASTTELCDDVIKYRFYCGCPESDDSTCGLCSGVSTPFPDLVLPGLGPDYIPEEAFTCGEVERQRSLLDTCDAVSDDVSKLCGCDLPQEGEIPCTTLCPDGTLIPEKYTNVTVLLNQPTFGNMTCGEYQLLIAEGLFFSRDCKAAHYVGLKHCGCDEEDIDFCDLCEDGDAVEVETLSKRISFQATCLDWAGDAFGFGADAPECSAYQSSAGVYCECNNPIASRNACRICDDNGGDVVPDPNLTVVIDGFAADCGELEFAGNNPAGNYTCDLVRAELGVQCCEDAPSAAPSVSPAPTFASTLSFGDTPVPTSKLLTDPPTPGTDNTPETASTDRPSSSNRATGGAVGSVIALLIMAFGLL